ncbi:hypothetical protein BDW74DRAFT_155518 [Aspergillus multicolor]|uniref:uncharacterized protein n=1 Tax=Aspergillus multicolor TaxID=41759 RepID=UPI003CCC99C6
MPLSLQRPRPKNKPRIRITLHARGKNSLGENRARLKYSALHWGVLISPNDINIESRWARVGRGRVCACALRRHGLDIHRP